MSTNKLELMSNAIRALALDAIAKANSGHPGMPLGFADVATVLFSEFLKFIPSKPKWADRDRFVLSAGHGSMLLYSLLYLTGFEDCTIDEIKNFRHLGSKTAGHPEYGHLMGVETTTGPLGQGIANAVGMAITEAHLKARFGKDLVNHKTYCVVGDGCLMEGISYEALSLAGTLKLKNLIVLWDNNEITIDGPTSITRNEDMKLRMESIDFQYIEADGHNFDSIRRALQEAQISDKPVFINFKTKIGYGSPLENTSKCHGSPIKDENLLKTKEKLGINYNTFEVPDDVLKFWRETSNRNLVTYQNWKNNLEKSEKFEDFCRTIKNGLPNDWSEKLESFKKLILQEQPREATRKSSYRVLENITNSIDILIGGSADLTGSVLTKTQTTDIMNAENYSGRYINYGIREHAMAGIMNGMALHKGAIPYAGTFFCFSDYQKPSIRLSALMRLQVLYILTHDSIGLGEDGPTHQPVEHLASLRSIPNLNVFRPADLQETIDCYSIALENTQTPSAMVLSRQAVPFIPNKSEQNNVKLGAYIIVSDKNPDVVLIASGSEVSLALDTKDLLNKDGINATVISAPCLEIFDRQSQEYKNKILPKDKLCIAIEAGSAMSWYKYIGKDGLFFGIPDQSFGISASEKNAYKYFGLTSENISKKILEHLSKTK